MKKKSKFNIRIIYNSPVILTFCIICSIILLLDKTLLADKNFILSIFTAPGSAASSEPFNFKSALDYVRLFTHVFGHADWQHLASNLTFILLLGPLLEERYGSPMIALMITVTALVTGVLNVCFMPQSLLGASGIAFMLIILASFTSISKNEIPLSFILVFAIFLGSEIFGQPANINISVLAHVAGGLCGSMFGFLIAPKAKKPKRATDSQVQELNADDFREKPKPKWGEKKVENKSYNNSGEEEVLGTIEL